MQPPGIGCPHYSKAADGFQFFSTGTDKAPWSAGRCYLHRSLHRPLIKAAAGSEDPRCRFPGGTAVEENPRCRMLPDLWEELVSDAVAADVRRAAGDLGKLPEPVLHFRMAQAAEAVWVEDTHCLVSVLPSCFCGTTRPAAEYIGYTWSHLPVKVCSTPELRNPEAKRAIFAARMAFSSLLMR